MTPPVGQNAHDPKTRLMLAHGAPGVWLVMVGILFFAKTALDLKWHLHQWIELCLGGYADLCKIVRVRSLIDVHGNRAEVNRLFESLC